jgi:MFS family permease
MRLPFFYGWLIVAIVFVTMGIGVNARTSFALVFPEIIDEYGWHRGVTAGVFSFGFLMSAIMSPVMGKMMDRSGPRLVMEMGVLLMVAGLLLATVATQPWHLYMTLGALVGAGSICLSYTGQSLFLPNWFVRKRGLAAGIAFAGVGIGSIVLLPWMQAMIDQVGWRQAYWILGIGMLVVLGPINLLLYKKPEDIGLQPDGDGRGKDQATAAPATSNIVDPVWAAVDWTLPKAMRTTRFWWLSLGYFCGLYVWYAVQIHQTKYLVEIGFTPTVAAWALGFVSFVGIPGQIVLGHVSDRIGRELVWVISCFGFVLCYGVLMALAFWPSMVLVGVMVMAQGVFGYGMASLLGAIVLEIYQGRNFGSIFGTVMVVALAGGAVGPWLTGLLHDVFGDYTLAFFIGMIMSLLSAWGIWMAAPRKVRAVAGRVHLIRKPST